MPLHTVPSKVAKQILPAGHKTYDNINFNWSKRSGHAGSRMIERALDKAKELGFVKGKFNGFNSPDGNVVGSKSYWHHPEGWELEEYSSYGCVAYDNYFSMTLKQVAKVPA